MVTIKSDAKGRLHHLWVRDRNLRKCFFDMKSAVTERDRLNKAIAEKLAAMQQKKIAA